MVKKFVIVAAAVLLVLIILAIGSYFYLSKPKPAGQTVQSPTPTSLPSTETSAQKTSNAIEKAAANPAAKIPSANPYDTDKTVNPYKKVNPFD